jgi:cytochrome b561
MVLHWTIAALIAWNLVLGFRMHSASGLAEFTLFQLHKSVGISVLLASLVRLAWRLANPPPPFSASMSVWEKTAAHVVHCALYMIMIGMPLTGWIVVSTSPLNIPTLLFHTIPWPHFPIVNGLALPLKTTVNSSFDTTHMILAWSALALLALHVGGALKHMVVHRDGVMARMLPFGRPPAVEGQVS